MPTIATHPRGRALLSILGLCLFLVSIGLSSLGSSPNAPQNLAPYVQFTNAPENGSFAWYREEIAWTGNDPDSADDIHHFEYAIDPPEVFTPEEIAHPETAPGVTISVRPGSEAGHDTVDVAKTVNDTLYAFSWIGTTETNRIFTFETPTYRPVNYDYLGEHSVWLRAQDEEGAYSEPDSREFIAQNQAPATQIIYPENNFDILSLGLSVYVLATGTDPDLVSSTGKPVAYLTKLLRLDTLDPPVSIVTAQPSLLFEGGDSTWMRHEGDSLEVTLPVAAGSYLFGVRAVDENGGTDRILTFSRNAFKFQASSGGGAPVLTLEEPSIGTFEFSGTPPAEDVEAPGNTPLNFVWTATSHNYPGLVYEFSWGVDLADPASETGWTPWNPQHTPGYLLQFSGGETHTFHVRTRDIAGTTTRGAVSLTMVEMTFDREVLLVDDSFDNLNPNDMEHDAFWQDLVSDYVLNSDLPADQFFEFSVHGDGDRESLDPNVPLLSDLARYKLLIWVNHGAGYNGQSALVKSTAIKPALIAYLRAGGRLWLSGRMTVGATTADANLVGADLTYPKTELGPGDFAWDYLKLHSTRINNDKGMQQQHLLHSVWPFPGTPAIYDSMVVDVQKLSVFQQFAGGYAHADAVFDPIFAESEPGFEGDIDTLYSYGAAGPEVQGHGSVYHGKLCGLRWHSNEVNPLHGRVQWFGFSMYYMQTEQARNTFRQSMDWLRQDDGPVPVGLLSMMALRNGNDVTVRWTVTEGWEDAAYSVYREDTSREREKVSSIYSGRLQYDFVDRNAPSGAVSYWIAEQDRTGETTWHGPLAVAARGLEARARLAAVHPNPVSGSARLTYSLASAGHVLLSVHDVAGREVGLLVNETQDAGTHEVPWEPARGNLAAGFYVIRLEAGGVSDVRKVMLLP